MIRIANTLRPERLRQTSQVFFGPGGECGGRCALSGVPARHARAAPRATAEPEPAFLAAPFPLCSLPPKAAEPDPAAGPGCARRPRARRDPGQAPRANQPGRAPHPQAPAFMALSRRAGARTAGTPHPEARP